MNDYNAPIINFQNINQNIKYIWDIALRNIIKHDLKSLIRIPTHDLNGNNLVKDIPNTKSDVIASSIKLSNDWSEYKRTLSKSHIRTNNRKRRNLNKRGETKLRFILSERTDVAK